METCSVKTVYESTVDSEKEMADPADNHDGMEKTLDATLIKTFNSSANGLLGTVAGTVINTLLYNSMEATNGRSVHTDDEDTSTEGSTEYTLGLDPLMVVTTNGCCGTEEVHCIGCGKAHTCVCVEAEADVKIGCEITTAYETLH